MRGRWRGAALNLGLIVALMGAASLLPSDTSVADRRRAGILRLCLPVGAAPGSDAAQALAQRTADALGVRLLVNRLPSIGRDFNIRAWGISRGQCDLIAPVVDNDATRGFLQTVPTGSATGWALTAAAPSVPQKGQRVGVWPGSSGLDRLALSGWLRSVGARVAPYPTAQALATALQRGEVEAAIADSGAAITVPGTTTRWLTDLAPDVPAALGPKRLALGLWKGEAMLRRATVTAQHQAE